MRNVTHSGMHVCEFRIDTTDYFLFYFSLFTISTLFFFLPSSFLNYSVCFLDLFCFLLHYTLGLADQVTSASLPFRIMHLYWSDSEALVTTLHRVWGARFLFRRFALGTLFSPRDHLGSAPTPNRLGFEGHRLCSLFRFYSRKPYFS